MTGEAHQTAPRDPRPMSIPNCRLAIESAGVIFEPMVTGPKALKTTDERRHAFDRAFGRVARPPEKPVSNG